VSPFVHAGFATHLDHGDLGLGIVEVLREPSEVDDQLGQSGERAGSGGPRIAEGRALDGDEFPGDRVGDGEVPA